MLGHKIAVLFIIFLAPSTSPNPASFFATPVGGGERENRGNWGPFLEAGERCLAAFEG